MPWTQSGLQSLICPVPVPCALFLVQVDQLSARAPKLASPQAMITSLGLNFGLKQLAISSGVLPLSLATGPLAPAVAVIASTISAGIPTAINLLMAGTLPIQREISDAHRRFRTGSKRG